MRRRAAPGTIFHAADPAFAEQFLQQSRVAGSLSHPNILTVHESFEHNGTPYIAMEYLPRGSLRPQMKELSLPQIAGVMEGVLAGLTHAHTRGVTHRDLKPENVMITAEGQIRIADFGIAKAYHRAVAGRVRTDTTIGTPAYMTPEQAMEKDVGPWSDLYATGVIAYELVVGNLPFHDGNTPMAILLRHVNDLVPAPRTVKPGLDVRLADWISSLLEKSPSDQPASAEAAWDSLEDTMLQILGPRWRREAPVPFHGRLPQEPHYEVLPQQPTPAPFDERDLETGRHGQARTHPGRRRGAGADRRWPPRCVRWLRRQQRRRTVARHHPSQGAPSSGRPCRACARAGL
jgi:serine/threonine protein kinase